VTSQGALRKFRAHCSGARPAPGVVRLREALTQQLRAAVMHAGLPDLMSAWTRSAWGAGGYEMWMRQRDLLPPGSPQWALAQGQLARLDREFAR
jgi:hypothetical protein